MESRYVESRFNKQNRNINNRIRGTGAFSESCY